MKTFIKKLKKMDACPSAIETLKQCKNGPDAWKQCVRGGWLCWYLSMTVKINKSPTHRKLILSMLECFMTIKCPKGIAKSAKECRQLLMLIRLWCGNNLSVNAKRIKLQLDKMSHSHNERRYNGFWKLRHLADMIVDETFIVVDAEDFINTLCTSKSEKSLKHQSTCADIIRKHIPYPPRIR